MLMSYDHANVQVHWTVDLGEMVNVVSVFMLVFQKDFLIFSNFLVLICLTCSDKQDNISFDQVVFLKIWTGQSLLTVSLSKIQDRTSKIFYFFNKTNNI